MRKHEFKLVSVIIIIFFITSALIPIGVSSIIHKSNIKVDSGDKISYPLLSLETNAYDTYRDYTLSSNDKPKILLDAGHNQYYNPDRLSEFISLLNLLGDVVINYDRITSADLEGVKLLVIPNPELEEGAKKEIIFTQDEINAIHNFLDNGGSLYIMGTWSTYLHSETMNNITERYGIIWYDASVYDNTTYLTDPEINPENATYHVIVHVWADNNVTKEMGILDYVQEVYFDGTSIGIVPPQDPTLIEEGPYPIGIGDDDTYVVFENGTTKILDGNVIFHAAVKLRSGGRIFATGSTRCYAYNYVTDVLDDLVFTLLTVGWTLGLTPDQSLIPIIKRFSVSKETFILKDTGEVSVTIKNIANISKENMSLNLIIPYFLKVVGNITISRSSGTYEVPYIIGEMINLGTLEPLEELSISFTVRCVLGIKRSGSLGIQLYLQGSKIGEKIVTVSSRPAFDASASFTPFPLNLTITNMTILYVRIKNIASYTIRSIHITIPNVPEDILLNTTDVLIESLAPGQERTLAFKITTNVIGAYSLPVYITSENGGEDVIRATLIATTTRIIVFDEGHHQFVYFTSAWMKDFIDLLRKYAPVLILKGEIPEVLLTPSVTALYVLPNPQPSTGSPGDTTTPIMSDKEVEIIQKYLEDGGSVLMMGNWYRYFWPNNPGGYNAITSKYGLVWIDGDVYDPVNYIDATYHVVAKTFAKNKIAKMLTAGVSQIEFSGTALLATNTSIAIHHPIIIGNNESYVTDDQGNVIARGKDVLMIIASVIYGKGKLLACGSSYVFSSRYYYTQNEPFIANSIAWLLGVKELDIVISGVPYQINVGEEISLRVKVINRGADVLTAVQINIEYSAGIINRNGTTTYRVGDLEPGESFEVTWIMVANSPGSYRLVINATASNLPRPVIKEIIITYTKPTGQISPEIMMLASILLVLGLVFGLLAIYVKRYLKK